MAIVILDKVQQEMVGMILKKFAQFVFGRNNGNLSQCVVVSSNAVNRV
jgi:hypothetical protein